MKNNVSVPFRGSIPSNKREQFADEFKEKSFRPLSGFYSF